MSSSSSVSSHVVKLRICCDGRVWPHPPPYKFFSKFLSFACPLETLITPLLNCWPTWLLQLVICYDALLSLPSPRKRAVLCSWVVNVKTASSYILNPCSCPSIYSSYVYRLKYSANCMYMNRNIYISISLSLFRIRHFI